MAALKEHFKLNTSRYWELDIFRGIAIILMIIYHLTWDLNYFGVVQLVMTSGPWSWFARFIATMFISAMGISLVVSYNRVKDKLEPDQLRRRFFLRGAKIFGLGLIITAATYLFLDFQGARGFVIFGILHSIGFAIMAAYPFLSQQQRWFSLVYGIVFIGLGFYFDGQASGSPWLIWLGVKQFNRLMVDYYPVFPWLGVALVAIFLGHILYPGGQARFPLPNLFNAPPVKALAFLGQHSLLIYLIHQPILMAILILSGIGRLG